MHIEDVVGWLVGVALALAVVVAALMSVYMAWGISNEMADRHIFLTECGKKRSLDACVYDWRKSQAVELRGTHCRSP